MGVQSHEAQRGLPFLISDLLWAAICVHGPPDASRDQNRTHAESLLQPMACYSGAQDRGALLHRNICVYLIVGLVLITGHATGEEGRRQEEKQHKSHCLAGPPALRPSCHQQPKWPWLLPERLKLDS